MILLCSELNEIAAKYTRMLLLIKIQIVQAQNTCNLLHGSKDGVYVLLMYLLSAVSAYRLGCRQK